MVCYFWLSFHSKAFSFPTLMYGNARENQIELDRAKSYSNPDPHDPYYLNFNPYVCVLNRCCGHSSKACGDEKVRCTAD